MLTIKLGLLFEDTTQVMPNGTLGVWARFMNVEKHPDAAFDIYEYHSNHLKPKRENFTKEHRKILEAAGAVDIGNGALEVPDDISETKQEKMNEDFKTLCDKEIKIPTMRLTLKQIAKICRGPITEALLDNIKKYCKPVEKPSNKKKKS